MKEYEIAHRTRPRTVVSAPTRRLVGGAKVAKSLGIGPAHLKGASNEPARGAAMTSGPQLTNSLLRRA